MKKVSLNYMIRIMLSICVFFVVACKEECVTTVKYKEPVSVTVKLGESVATYHNFELILKSINIKKTPPADTTITKDSTTEAISCVLMIMHPDSTEKSEFELYPGKFTLFGNATVVEGKPFEHLKIQCDKLNFQPAESVNLTIWNATFMQDCNSW